MRPDLKLTAVCQLLLAAWLLLPGLPPAAQAQNRSRVLTTYYDSARTQRRAVFHVLLTGSRPDTVPHGPFRRYWSQGGLQELGHFSNGAADSIWTRYYPAKPGQQPQVARRLPMRDGKPDGAFTVWHPDGRIGQRGTFSAGQLVDSLVTLRATGEARLRGLFVASADGQLQGSFWQRGGRVTALPLGQDRLLNGDFSYDNSYPDYNPQRYWTGQLLAGRLVGTHTERDPDGQPTIRLSYTARGRLRLITRYYPAEWRRNELLRDYDEATRRDSVIPSSPFWQWEPVSRQPFVVLRQWRLEGETPNVTLLQAVPAGRLPDWYSADVIGARRREEALARYAPELTARLEKFTAVSQPAECRAALAAYKAQRRPVLGLVKSQAGRWLLGVADTTGATSRPLRRRQTPLPNGRRLVETRRTSRTYYASGQLETVDYRRNFGRELSRGFYPNGKRKDVARVGLLATYERSWNEEGRSTGFEPERLLGVRMVPKRTSRLRDRQYKTIRNFRPLLWKSKPKFRQKKRRRSRPKH